jgi:hypothetical protein
LKDRNKIIVLNTYIDNSCFVLRGRSKFTCIEKNYTKFQNEKFCERKGKRKKTRNKRWKRNKELSIFAGEGTRKREHKEKSKVKKDRKRFR